MFIRCGCPVHLSAPPSLSLSDALTLMVTQLADNKVLVCHMRCYSLAFYLCVFFSFAVFGAVELVVVVVVVVVVYVCVCVCVCLYVCVCVCVCVCSFLSL